MVPGRRSGLVERPQLVSALEAGRSRRLTLVSAPTGFGWNCIERCMYFPIYRKAPISRASTKVAISQVAPLLQ